MIDLPLVQVLLDELGLPPSYPKMQWYQRRLVSGLVTDSEQGLELSEAIWWYKLDREGKPDAKVTSFNARNLAAPLWRNAIRSRRGLVFASEIGESDGQQRYLMRSQQGLALGALYKDWSMPDGSIQRSVAIITRPPHPEFSRFHPKSLPLFLPLNKEILETWLDRNTSDHAAIDTLLNDPKIYSDLQVQQVKTYKRGEPIGPEMRLSKD